MCRWDDGTEHVCEILDQRPIEEEGTTSYYVHYVDFDRRLDDWVKEERMSDAPAEGAQGGKPWVTIFAKDAFRGEFFVFLPLMIEQGADTDSVMINDASKDYAEGLLLAEVRLSTDPYPYHYPYP